MALKLTSLKYITESIFSQMVGVPPEGAVDVLGENCMANSLFCRALGAGGFIALPPQLQAGF